MSQNRVIGSNNAMPWHIPGELVRFKKITTGHPIIMGRKTFESIGRPLPNRTNIVITRNAYEITNKYKGLINIVVPSLSDAIEEAKQAPGNDEIFIIGGGEIFKQAMPLADKIYLTLIHKDIDGDTFFPEYEKIFTKEVVPREDREHDGFKYSFLVLQKE